jgi:ribonucleoside-diphosphate reductase alpha chain
MTFRTELAQAIFLQKYAHEGCETWPALAKTLAEDVCGSLLSKSVVSDIARLIEEMKFLPGGRYLYYAGRDIKAFNNCFLLNFEDDSREEWANVSWRAENCLMTGGGIGVDYSPLRGRGSPLKRTGGTASGPVSKMRMINEIGREVMQGGSRRSAIWAGLNWQHADIQEFLHCKDWDRMIMPGTGMSLKDAKAIDFNWPAPLDMTNVSVGYDDKWLVDPLNEVFLENVRQALRTGEPGMSFNFDDQSAETLRNACCEVTSADDSDVCNLGSLNMSRIETLKEFRDAAELGTLFLLCGTLKAHLPYEKVYAVRSQNRRLGLGLMGVHEWLMQRNKRYVVTDELHEWLDAYETVSNAAAARGAYELSVSRPVAVRAIAPTGTIGLLAGTTTGIEPLYAVAYKRRYLKNGTDWHYQYVVDGTAKELIDRYDTDPEKIESAIDLAADPERRIKFQWDVQSYVDMAISSTINLPEWGSPLNNEDTVLHMAETLAKYAPGLRGFTCYPDGSRGGQPLESVPYREALDWEGVEFAEHDSCKGGVCGI